MVAYIHTTPRTVRKSYGLYDRRWQRYSQAFIQRYPFCVLCLCRGKLNEGAIEFSIERQRSLIVDHIEPHRGNEKLFWDENNHQTLCRTPCHDRDKQRCEKTNQSWSEYLRRTMRGHEAFVESQREYVPESVLKMLALQDEPASAGGVY